MMLRDHIHHGRLFALQIERDPQAVSDAEFALGSALGHVMPLSETKTSTRHGIVFGFTTAITVCCNSLERMITRTTTQGVFVFVVFCLASGRIRHTMSETSRRGDSVDRAK